MGRDTLMTVSLHNSFKEFLMREEKNEMVAGGKSEAKRKGFLKDYCFQLGEIMPCMYADREDNRNLMMKVWQKVLMMCLISEGVGSGVQVGGQGLDYEDEWCIYANRRADSPRV